MLSPKTLIKTPVVLELARQIRIAPDGPLAFVVQGEHGVGKRTAVEAALATLDPDKTLILRADADEYRGTFAPLSSLFLDLLQQQERIAGLKRVLATLLADVLQLLPVPQFVSQTVKDLYDALVPDRRYTPTETSDLLYRLERVFHAASANRRVCVVFRNIELYDASSLSVIAQLLRRRINACFFLTFNPFARDSEDAHPERLLQMLNSLVLENKIRRVRAEPFDFEQTRALISSFFPDHHFTVEQERLIHERSGGTALVIREILVHLIGERLLTLDGDGARLSPQFATATVPAVIQDLIEARLQTLDEDLRGVLDIASVIGQRFSHEPIAGRLTLQELVVLNRLRDLQHRHNLVSEDLQSHRFVFDAVRETIYSALGPATTRSHHRFLAEYFADHPVPQDNEFLVYYHYVRAGDHNLALEHLLKAADAARNASGYAESARRLRLARDLLGKLQPEGREALAMLALDEGRASFDAGMFDESVGALREAAELTNDPSNEGAILLAKGLAEYFREEPHVADASFLQFFARPRPHIEGSVVRAAHLARSSVLYALGRWDEARQEYQAGLPRSSDDATIFEIANARKRMNMFLWPEMTAPAIARSISDLEPFQEQSLYWELTHNLGSNYLLLGDLAQSDRLLLDATSAFRRMRSFRVAYPLNNLSIVKLVRNELEDAQRLAEEVVKAPASEFDLICAQNHLAIIAALRGHCDSAISSLRAIETSLEGSTEHVLIEITRHNLAWALDRCGLVEEAVHTLQSVPACTSRLWGELTAARRERMLRRMQQDTTPVHPDSALGKLERTRHPHAWLFRDVDYEVGDVWFWE